MQCIIELSFKPQALRSKLPQKTLDYFNKHVIPRETLLQNLSVHFLSSTPQNVRLLEKKLYNPFGLRCGRVEVTPELVRHQKQIFCTAPDTEIQNLVTELKANISQMFISLDTNSAPLYKPIYLRLFKERIMFIAKQSELNFKETKKKLSADDRIN